MSGLGQLSHSGEVKAVYSFVSCANMDLRKKKVWGPFFTAEQSHTQGRGKAEEKHLSSNLVPKNPESAPFSLFPIHYLELKPKVF